MTHKENINAANLETEEVNNLQRLEKDFCDRTHKEIILVAYEK